MSDQGALTFPPAVARVPVCLCVDTSWAMSNHMNNINLVVRKFDKAIKEKSMSSLTFEIATVSFGGGKTEELIKQYGFKEDSPKSFQVRENKPLGEAMCRALDAIEARQRIYAAQGIDSRQAILVLISDGRNSGEPEALQSAQTRTKNMITQRKLSVILVGVGKEEEIKRETLQSFSPSAPIWPWRDVDFNTIISNVCALT